ncbi:DUF58 domain-containing protein [bacterium]|nr:DUF58 domain-containing protein [bacterium]
MKLFKSFYLQNRFFYAAAGLVALFFISYVLPLLFYPALATMAFLLVATAVESYLLFKNKSNFYCRRELVAVASLHHNHQVNLKVKNRLKNRLLVTLVDELPYQLENRDFELTFTLGGNKTKNASYTILPVVRGAYSFGHINLFASTLLGFVARRQQFSSEQELSVMPSVYEMRQQELLAMKNLNFGNGENKTRFLGKSYEFDQLKNYVHGDDPRNINWKATSKTRNLMVNHFEDERSQQVYAVIDKGRNMKMPFDQLTLFDYAINATLAFSNIVLKKHDKAGLLTFSEKLDQVVAAEWSPRQLMKIQYALYAERYHYTEPNFELLALQLRKLVPNRSMIFLYTNFDTLEALERALPSLKIINRLHRLIVIFFTNTELEAMGKSFALDVLEIYQNTMAEKFISEKELISKELRKHGIASILTKPAELSANTINKYLELKAVGAF